MQRNIVQNIFRQFSFTFYPDSVFLAMTNRNSFIGRERHCVDLIGSTNTELLNNQKKYTHGTVLQALRQSAGRGRYSRQWDSMDGGLYFSFLLKDVKFIQSTYPLVLLSAFSVLKCLSQISSKDVFNIKWPNDIYCGNRKICGILAESATCGDESHVVVGIGININNPVYDLTSLRNPAIALKDIIGKHIDPDTVLTIFLKIFNENYHNYMKSGLNPFLKNMNKHLYARGENILLSFHGEKQQVIPLSFLDNGDLLCTINGLKKHLHFGELE